MATFSFEDALKPASSGAFSFEDATRPVKQTPLRDTNTELSLAEKAALMFSQSRPDVASLLDTLANPAKRLAQGAADPIVGTVQLGANLIGQGDQINAALAEKQKQYEAERAASGSTGLDWLRTAGNVLSPVNLLGAGAVTKLAPQALAATTNLGRAAAGGTIGAVSGAMEPVTEGNYANEKFKQIGAGAVGGAVLGPVAGKVGDWAAGKFAREAPDVAHVRASLQAEAQVNRALEETGQTLADIPASHLDKLKADIRDALLSGQKLDAAASLRSDDFKALGITPTRAQLTRDPMQFAQEQNLKGVAGVGDPLTARFTEQNNALQRLIGKPAQGASNEYVAGTKLSESLKNVDDVLRKHVSGLYGEAKASAGKDLEIPLQGLAQDYAKILGDFGDKVPGSLRTKFAALGLDPALPSNQKKLFTMEDADALLKNINQLDPGFSDKATSNALSQLRSAVKGAVTSVDESGGPFAEAVKAAKGRFKMQEAVPALKAASEGSVAPDDFVRRFVINGKTNEVKGLAGILKQASPDAYAEARGQLASTLQRAAFGENATGDAAFSASRYMQQLRKIGPDKLSAFFTPKEVQDLMRAGRVAAYKNQAPSDAVVNRSGTSSAAANLLGLLNKVPGGSAAVSVAKSATGSVQNGANVRNALAGTIPTEAAPMTPAQTNMLRYFLLGGGVVGGAGLAGMVRQ